MQLEEIRECRSEWAEIQAQLGSLKRGREFRNEWAEIQAQLGSLKRGKEFRSLGMNGLNYRNSYAA